MVEGQDRAFSGSLKQILQPQLGLQPSPVESKMLGGAAAPNFFFPGLGRIHLSMSRSGGGTYAPSSVPADVSPYIALILPALLLPFAFACDGYRRAQSP